MSSNQQVTNIEWSGFNSHRQNARAQDSASVVASPSFEAARARRGDLYIAHYRAVLKLCGGRVPDAILSALSEFSKEALSAGAGSQPSQMYPDPVQYAKLLTGLGYIDCNLHGRKPPKVFAEAPCRP